MRLAACRTGSVDDPTASVTGPVSQRREGSGGAVGVRGVTSPEGAIDQTNNGASSRSVCSPGTGRPRERQRLPAGVHQTIVQARVRGADQMVGDDQVEDQGGDHVAHHHDERRHRGDPHRVPPVGPGRVHLSTIR